MAGGTLTWGRRTGAGLALAAAFLLAACEEKNTYVPPPPPKVTVAAAIEQPVANYLQLTGNTAAVNAVDLNARVQGFLTAINYTDGQPVRKGDVLFVIEQSTYKANLEQAKATLAANQALLVQAEAEYKRQAQLAKQDFASQAVLDQAQAKRDSSLANVKNAEAAVEMAQINLGYTEVTAPFDGIVTAHLQDVGALVGYSGPTKLATIVQIDPIYVWFSLSEQQVLRIRENLAREGVSVASISKHIADVPVEIGLQTEEGYPHRGRLDYVAPQVDSNLGTLTVRGVFDNADDALMPGLFARVRLPLGQPKPTVLVPDAIISYNQQGPYVLVVDADNVVSQAQIVPGQLQADGLRAIESGLKPGQKVVIAGIQRAVPGSKVEPVAGTIAGRPASGASAASAATPPKN